MMPSPQDEESLLNFFNQQENTLQLGVDEQFFQSPKQFRYLKCLIEVLGSNSDSMKDSENMSLQTLKEKNPAVQKLFTQRKVVTDVVEEIVKFQHGALNNSVETMGSVITEYTRCRSDIGLMRESIADVKRVLTSKKNGQVNLKQLWLKKKELEERIRILKSVEMLSDAPRRINQLLQKHCYLTAVNSLNTSIANMFSEDLVGIGGLKSAREELMEQKSFVLECIVNQLRDSLLGLQNFESKEERTVSVAGDTESVDTRSEYNASVRSHKIQSARNAAAGSNGMGKISSLDRADSVRHTEWSMDLSEADEELERSLQPDPRSSGTMFIRLLVRAVGALASEDDVERMLLDDAPQKLVNTIRVLKAREAERVGDHTTMGEEAQQQIFTDYIHKVLDAIYLSLRKLMYGLHLLRLSRNTRHGGSKSLWSANENTKKAVLAIGAATARVIQKELEVHLVEQEVMAISDKIETGKSPNTNGSLLYGDYMDSEDTLDDIALDKLTLCAPSVKLVAPVYQDIINFSSKIKKLFKEECSMRDDEIPPSRIVSTVERISLMELLPLIQSHVSQSINEIQSDSSHFSPPKKGDDLSLPRNELSAVGGASRRLGARSGVTVGSVPPGKVCSAAVKCLIAIRPLLTYWFQLPQHADAVVTIIDRAIRGFASSARDELDNLTWKLHAAEGKVKASILGGMQTDTFFVEYRRSVYGENCSTIDEMLGLSTPSLSSMPTGSQASPVSRKSIRASVSDRSGVAVSAASLPAAAIASSGPSDSLSVGNMTAELDGWNDLWTLNSPQYPTSSEKICSDIFATGTIVSLSLGCDWLAREICRECIKVVGRARIQSIGGGTPTGMPHTRGGLRGSIRNSFSGGAVNGHEDSPAVAALISIIHGAVKGLSKLAEEGLAIVRGDLEVSCFHLLHHLAHVKFSRGAIISSVSSPVAAPSGLGGGGGNARERETDNAISAFNKHFIFMQDIFLSASVPEAFAVVISPCCYLAPRIFMRCIRFLSGPVSSDGFNRLMRAVIACHQSISMLLESSRLDPSTCRRLQDRVTDGFDKVRRYVSFMGAGAKELEVYIINSPTEYTYKEYETMWNLLKDPTKSFTFQDAWSAIKAGTTISK